MLYTIVFPEFFKEIGRSVEKSVKKEVKKMINKEIENLKESINKEEEEKQQEKQNALFHLSLCYGKGQMYTCSYDKLEYIIDNDFNTNQLYLDVINDIEGIVLTKLGYGSNRINNNPLISEE